MLLAIDLFFFNTIHLDYIHFGKDFNHHVAISGGLGEADPGGGDSSHQVLQSVEETEGEGDPAGDLWQREGNYPPTSTFTS